MDISIKDHIINNLKNSSDQEVRKSIENSINDEVALPGLGVLMTILWQNSDENEKKAYLNMLSKSLNQNANEQAKKYWFLGLFIIHDLIVGQ